MNSDDVRKQIETTFKAEFGAAFPTVPVQYENVRFKQPTNKAWADIRIVEGDNKRMNLGDRKRYRVFGVINVTCMVPQEDGTVFLNAMTDKAFTVLADRQWKIDSDSITTYGGKKVTRGEINGLYTKNVVVEYHYDTEIIR